VRQRQKLIQNRDEALPRKAALLAAPP